MFKICLVFLSLLCSQVLYASDNDPATNLVLEEHRPGEGRAVSSGRISDSEEERDELRKEVFDMAKKEIYMAELNGEVVLKQYWDRMFSRVDYMAKGSHRRIERTLERLREQEEILRDQRNLDQNFVLLESLWQIRSILEAEKSEMEVLQRSVSEEGRKDLEEMLRGGTLRLREAYWHIIDLQQKWLDK